MSEKITCVRCKRTFTREWSEDEALAEYEQRFGDQPRGEGSFCDDCYHAFLQWLKARH